MVGRVNERKHTVRLSFAALGVCLNILGSFLVMITRLPIYGDTLGTIFVGVFQLPMVASVFLVQVFTDYADKFLILVIVTLIIQRIPTRIKEKV